jgi:hypothetical protein
MDNMNFIGKYKIVTGITSEYKMNPENPKYFAKFINDNVQCLGNTEYEAIERLKILYEKYKIKNKLFPFYSEKVLNPYVSKLKYGKYFASDIYVEFFDLIEEYPWEQFDDEFTLGDLDLSDDKIESINHKYNIKVSREDLLFDILEQIDNLKNRNSK